MKIQIEYGYVHECWPRGGFLFSDSHLVLDTDNEADKELWSMYKQTGDIKLLKERIAHIHNTEDISCITIKDMFDDNGWTEVYQ